MPNPQVTQSEVIDSVVECLTPKQRNDLPMIRELLNDTMDALRKEGRLTSARSDQWSQDRMVTRVQRQLKARALATD